VHVYFVHIIIKLLDTSPLWSCLHSTCPFITVYSPLMINICMEESNQVTQWCGASILTHSQCSMLSRKWQTNILPNRYTITLEKSNNRSCTRVYSARLQKLIWAWHHILLENLGHLKSLLGSGTQMADNDDDYDLWHLTKWWTKTKHSVLQLWQAWSIFLGCLFKTSYNLHYQDAYSTQAV